MQLFEIFTPKINPCALLSIPHSGEFIPEEFLSFLTSDQRALLEDVDYKVRDLIDIDKLVYSGVIVTIANVHRACVDLNRASDIAVLNWKENTHGVQLVTHEPSADNVTELIKKYHRPYFEILEESILKIERSSRKKVPMIDLHSMPSKPTAYHLKINPNQKTERADFCISDLKGISCRPEFIKKISKELESRGYVVAINDPYFGGYVTKHVNQFSTDNIQIEINRSIYMDEIEKTFISEKVGSLKEALTDSILNTFRMT